MQSKETSTAPWSAAGLGDGGGRNAAAHCRATSGMQLPMDWRGRFQADHATRVQESGNFQLGGPEKLTRVDAPRHSLQENEGLADLLYMDDGDILCHSILVPSFMQEFDVAHAKVGAERKPQKTVIYNVNDMDAAPPERRIRDVQNMAKVVTAGSITLGVAVGPNAFSFARPADGICPPLGEFGS